jgi:hypothetical protein
MNDLEYENVESLGTFGSPNQLRGYTVSKYRNLRDVYHGCGNLKI